MLLHERRANHDRLSRDLEMAFAVTDDCRGCLFRAIEVDHQQAIREARVALGEAERLEQRALDAMYRFQEEVCKCPLR